MTAVSVLTAWLALSILVAPLVGAVLDLGDDHEEGL